MPTCQLVISASHTFPVGHSSLPIISSFHASSPPSSYVFPIILTFHAPQFIHPALPYPSSLCLSHYPFHLPILILRAIPFVHSSPIHFSFHIPSQLPISLSHVIPFICSSPYHLSFPFLLPFISISIQTPSPSVVNLPHRFNFPCRPHHPCIFPSYYAFLITDSSSRHLSSPCLHPSPLHLPIIPASHVFFIPDSPPHQVSLLCLSHHPLISPASAPSPLHPFFPPLFLKLVTRR